MLHNEPSLRGLRALKRAPASLALLGTAEAVGSAGLAGRDDACNPTDAPAVGWMAWFRTAIFSAIDDVREREDPVVDAAMDAIVVGAIDNVPMVGGGILAAESGDE